MNFSAGTNGSLMDKPVLSACNQNLPPFVEETDFVALATWYDMVIRLTVDTLVHLNCCCPNS
jgi:hypothetical protein